MQSEKNPSEKHSAAQTGFQLIYSVKDLLILQGCPCFQQ